MVGLETHECESDCFACSRISEVINFKVMQEYALLTDGYTDLVSHARRKQGALNAEVLLAGAIFGTKGELPKALEILRALSWEVCARLFSDGCLSRGRTTSDSPLVEKCCQVYACDTAEAAFEHLKQFWLKEEAAGPRVAPTEKPVDLDSSRAVVIATGSPGSSY
eukprot:4353826-Amphidinium_carterae.2